MNHLFTYVTDLKEQAEGFSIIEQTQSKCRVEDEGILIESSELIVKFENDVTLRKQMERDHADENGDEVCSECWISYEVISQPENLKVTPKKKSFTNPCQESFWLKINKV